MNFVCVNFGDTYHNAYVDALYYMLFMNKCLASTSFCFLICENNFKVKISSLVIFIYFISLDKILYLLRLIII